MLSTFFLVDGHFSRYPEGHGSEDLLIFFASLRETQVIEQVVIVWLKGKDVVILREPPFLSS